MLRRDDTPQVIHDNDNVRAKMWRDAKIGCCYCLMLWLSEGEQEHHTFNLNENISNCFNIQQINVKRVLFYKTKKGEMYWHMEQGW